MTLKILIADDHALVRDGVRPFLEELADVVEIFEADNFDRVQALTDRHADLDLAILDLAMPGMKNLDGVRAIRETHPRIPLVILSGQSDSSVIFKAFDLGISGFIPKSAGSEIMMSALNLVLAGERYVPSQLLNPVEPAAVPQVFATDDEDDQPKIRNTAIVHRLSNRERTVLEHLVGGMTNKEIARAIDLQESTVKIHVKNIYRKIGVVNRAQAVRTVIQPEWNVPPSGPLN